MFHLTQYGIQKMRNQFIPYYTEELNRQKRFFPKFIET